MPERVPQTDFVAALRVLTKADINFIVIGALAGIAHGLGRATYDVDVVYARTPENMRKIVQALLHCVLICAALPRVSHFLSTNAPFALDLILPS